MGLASASQAASRSRFRGEGRMAKSYAAGADVPVIRRMPDCLDGGRMRTIDLNSRRSNMARRGRCGGSSRIPGFLVTFSRASSSTACSKPVRRSPRRSGGACGGAYRARWPHAAWVGGTTGANRKGVNLPSALGHILSVPPGEHSGSAAARSADRAFGSSRARASRVAHRSKFFPGTASTARASNSAVRRSISTRR
jgi:hypothetical protein